MLGWNRFKCIHVTRNSNCLEVSLTPSTFRMRPPLILTKTEENIITTLQTWKQIQVKEIAPKRHTSTPKHVTNFHSSSSALPPLWPCLSSITPESLTWPMWLPTPQAHPSY